MTLKFKLDNLKYFYKNMIDSRVYYYLVNSQSNKALAFKNAKQPSKQNGFLTDISEEQAEEVWMLKKTHFQKTYYLMHCLTGLVLEKNRNKMQLHHMHQKPSQYFIVTESHNENGQVWFKEYTQPTNMLTFDEKLLECKKKENFDREALWKLKKMTKNIPIDTTSILSCQFSGYVLQAGLDQKQGRPIQKASWIGCFNQRWEIRKVNAFYIIRNLKNHLLISLNDKKVKEGSSVVLASERISHHFQLWSLQERGYNTYAIKTAYHQELYIGVKDHNLNEGCPLQLVRNEFKNVWRMVGQIIL